MFLRYWVIISISKAFSVGQCPVHLTQKGKKGIYLNPTQGGRKHQEGLLPRITPFPSLSAPEVKTLSSFIELWGKSLRETVFKGSKLCLENCVITWGTKTAIRQVKKVHHLDWNPLHEPNIWSNQSVQLNKPFVIRREKQREVMDWIFHQMGVPKTQLRSWAIFGVFMNMVING